MTSRRIKQVYWLRRLHVARGVLCFGLCVLLGNIALAAVFALLMLAEPVAKKIAKEKASYSSLPAQEYLASIGGLNLEPGSECVICLTPLKDKEVS